MAAFLFGGEWVSRARGGLPVLSRRLLRFGDCFVKMKEAFYSCNFQSVVNALIYTDQAETASIFLSSDIGSDQRSNPRRISQRDLREVQNECARVIGAYFGLKAE